MKTVQIPSLLGFSVPAGGAVLYSLIYALGHPVWLASGITIFATLSVVTFLRSTKKVNFVIPRSASWLGLGFMLGWGFMILLSMLAPFI